MNKKRLISRVTEVLCSNDCRKPISIPKQVFHISDDEGNSKDFIVKKTDKNVLYNTQDVGIILEACMAVIAEAIRHGEKVHIQGFGSLSVHKRAARKTKHPESGEIVDVKERYVPKFAYGNMLKTAARVYEMSLADIDDEPDYIDDSEYDEDDELFNDTAFYGAEE